MGRKLCYWVVLLREEGRWALAQWESRIVRRRSDGRGGLRDLGFWIDFPIGNYMGDYIGFLAMVWS